MGSKAKKKGSAAAAEDILETLGDFTSKENWDKFFTLRSDSFEWYAEWPHLRDPLLSLLRTFPHPLPLPLLVPACGNSRLSEHLYDAGHTAITNVDFSKVVISDMLRRNVRDRPLMRWRVMDITAMQVPPSPLALFVLLLSMFVFFFYRFCFWMVQFEDESFIAVIDKGGLDALMEPELGPKLGKQYLSEVGFSLFCFTFVFVSARIMLSLLSVLRVKIRM